MKIYPLALALLLPGCSAVPSDSASRHNPADGRYAGIGVFDTSTLWSQIKGVRANKDPAKALLADDAHIIVSVDTRTGEIRQCGDISGYCTAMNPWTQTMQPQQKLPVSLNKHGSDFAAEASAQQR